MDVYGREQDMEQLSCEDVVCDGSRVAILLGNSSRGESVKTGMNQGVVVFRGVVSDLVMALVKYRQSGRLFGLSQAQMRQSWHQGLARLQLLFSGPLHALRHTGPSNDIAHDRLDLEGVRRRGRWLSIASVQRYSETFALVRYRSKMGEKNWERRTMRRVVRS